MKILSVGAESFHAYTETDLTKLIIVFPNFVIAPKNGGMNITSERGLQVV